MRRGLSAARVFASSRCGTVLGREVTAARRLVSSTADSAATTGEVNYARLQLENERLRKTVAELRSELIVAKMGPVRRFGQFVSNMPRKKFMRLMFLAFLLAQTLLTGAIVLYRSLPKQDEEKTAQGKEDSQIS